MQFDSLKAQTSIDAKTAQETLALALRLQQEHGERVTLDELHRTAAEAGIDPIYLEQALRRTTHNVPATFERFVRRHVVAIAVVASFSLVTVVALHWGIDHGEWTEAWATILVSATIGVRILLLTRRKGPKGHALHSLR